MHRPPAYVVPREPQIAATVAWAVNPRGGMANIKKFFLDRENRQVVLMSESTKDFPPIYIHEDDEFMVNGKVVQVIKKPRFE